MKKETIICKNCYYSKSFSKKRKEYICKNPSSIHHNTITFYNGTCSCFNKSQTKEKWYEKYFLLIFFLIPIFIGLVASIIIYIFTNEYLTFFQFLRGWLSIGFAIFCIEFIIGLVLTFDSM